VVDIQHVRIEPQPDTFVDLARKFAQLDAERRDLETRIKEVNEQKTAIEAQLILAFENHEIAGPITLRDVGLSVYVHTSRFASADPDHPEELRAALLHNGLGHFVKATISSQTLSAWVREVHDAGDEIPVEIAPYIKESTVHRIRTRKATR
jgi:hypothetical protein